ncbi:Alpha-1B-glycoprotein [Saguinus oedipus]|uniref:Alpha-1B-glycoprotein n=1 Tax=Saguinus oedipus TaxID=9490 RepID=A0ABQ9TYQ6_SAGOE|nr:Alpha-1B-glycoprotein [Saguinus oedipus]
MERRVGPGEAREEAGQIIAGGRLGQGKESEAGPRVRAEPPAWRPEKLPAPAFTAEPASPNPEPGTRVRLRCLAPLEGARFALVREDRGGRRVHSFQSPAGTEAHFELRNISVADSANYSCVYVDLKPPFSGSAPSARLELRVDGERAGNR